VQIQRPLKTDERNPMNMTPKVGKHRFGKKICGKMFVGTYRLSAHPMSMISTVGQHLLGDGDMR